MSEARQEEQRCLDAYQSSIRNTLAALDARLDEYAREIQSRKEYLRDARRDMDHIEKIEVRQMIEQTLDSADVHFRLKRQTLLADLQTYLGADTLARHRQVTVPGYRPGPAAFRRCPGLGA